MAIHSDESSFGCTHCDQRFKRRDHLTRHLKRVHRGDPWPCDHEQCEERFRTKYDLCRHRKSEHVIGGSSPQRPQETEKQETRKRKFQSLFHSNSSSFGQSERKHMKRIPDLEEQHESEMFIAETTLEALNEEMTNNGYH